MSEVELLVRTPGGQTFKLSDVDVKTLRAAFEKPVEQKLYTFRQASEALGLSIYTVRRWAREGRIAVVKEGNKSRISASELRRLTTPRGRRKTA